MSNYEYQKIEGLYEGHRIGVRHAPWMSGGYLVSHSPRNDNSFAEGPWEEWVRLAMSILQHPATQAVAPQVHKALQEIDLPAIPPLTDEQVAELIVEHKDSEFLSPWWAAM